jgi:hypothetical protein
MHLRLALLAVVTCVAAYGCATPEKQTATPSAAQPPPQDRYVTGSRVPIRDDSAGTSSVGTASKSDFEEEMRRMTPGSHGQ